MNYNINELIDFNISQIKDGVDVRKLELKGLDKKTLSDSMCSALFENLISESLINTDEYGRIYLLSRAYEIINYGGWVKFKIDTENKNNAKENLEIDILKLQKEASEYQKSIRNKEDQIRNLTSDNLRLGNWDIRFRWYISIISFIIGFIVKYFIDN